MPKFTLRQMVQLVSATGLYFSAVLLTVHNKVSIWRHLILGFIFILSATVDIATYTLPDSLTLGGALLGLLLPGSKFISSIKGGFVGLGIMAFIAGISRVVWVGRCKAGSGHGYLLGWPLVLPALVLSFCLGGSIGIILLLTKIKRRTDPIPFAPCLAVGTLVTSLWGQELVQWYLTTIWI